MWIIFHSHFLSILKRKVTDFMRIQLQNKHWESAHCCLGDCRLYSSSRSEINTHACGGDSAAPILCPNLLFCRSKNGETFSRRYKGLAAQSSPCIQRWTERSFFHGAESKQRPHRTHWNFQYIHTQQTKIRKPFFWVSCALVDLFFVNVRESK